MTDSVSSQGTMSSYVFATARKTHESVIDFPHFYSYSGWLQEETNCLQSSDNLLQNINHIRTVKIQYSSILAKISRLLIDIESCLGIFYFVCVAAADHPLS